jgi:hypothetical protein
MNKDATGKVGAQLRCSRAVVDPGQNPRGAELYGKIDLRLRPLSNVQRLLPKFQ